MSRIAWYTALLVLVCSSLTRGAIRYIPPEKLTDPLARVMEGVLSLRYPAIIPYLGYQINSAEHYWYRGNTKQLNIFLDRCAAASKITAENTTDFYEEVNWEIIIHEGEGMAWDPNSNKTEVAQWKLERIFAPKPEGKNGVVNVLNYNIHLWIDGKNIVGEKLTLPAEVPARNHTETP